MAETSAYSPREFVAFTEAGIALASELSLDVILQKLVDLAREVIGAQYGALSVLGPGGEIEQFLTSGITEEQRRLIGALPRGRGLLGVLLREGSTLRVDDMGQDSRSVGFPANHPPMRSLLGVPVISRGRIIGNLYLTEKTGTPAFNDRDEEIVRMLATQAAVAVRNAELYQAERRRAEEWKELFELGREVTALPDVQRLLDSTVSRARHLLVTDMAVLMLLRPGDQLYLAAHEGLISGGVKKLRPLSEDGLQSLTLASMAPVIILHCETDERLRERRAALFAEERLASLICVPLRGKEGPLGTVTVGNRQSTVFNEWQAELLEAFANWTAVAIEASRLYERLESLARLEERERIGMDLHDGVIQSIYAVGLNLEDCLDRLSSEPPNQIRAAIEKAMEDLTLVIKDIRSYIFDLRPPLSQVTELPQALEQLIEELRVNSLVEAEVTIEGELGETLSEKQATALFHIAQEALNNVSKHSGASRVNVRLASGDGRILLEVQDNGRGFQVAEGGPQEKQGLRNMRDRTRSIGGDMAIQSAPGKGVTIRVEVAERLRGRHDE